MNSKHAQTLTDLDLKVTRARVAILEILEKANKPVDVGEIIDGLEKKRLDTDMATVYRIVDIFYKNRLIDRLEFGEGKFRYEFAREEHHHIICEKCGRIEDVMDCPIGELEASIAKKHSFEVTRHALEFFGLCSTCQ